MSVDPGQLTDLALLELLDEMDVCVPRGDARRRVAAVADAFATEAPIDEVHASLVEAADVLWDENVGRLERALVDRGADAALPPLDAGARESPLALALAHRAVLPVLARHERVKAPLRELEATFAALDEDDRRRLGPRLAPAATPALALDVDLLRDEGYRYVATYPPEGSEGVDIVGKAASWLTRRMTLDGQAPRAVLRHYLALLAEELEVDLPAVAATIDLLLEVPMPPLPTQDRLFVGLARGLVEDAVAERGFPF